VPLYVGLDSSTQSLTAVVLDIDRDTRRVVLETSLNFDAALPHYGTRHGVLPDSNPAVGVAPPLMWAEALDLMMGRLAHAIDVGRVAAISGSAQQHGSVYLGAGAASALASLDATKPLAGQLRGAFTRDTSPIWMDSSTSEECREITDAAGGEAALAHHTGSRAFERFTGPQIRRFFKQEPAAYQATARIHLVSSFLGSLLAGRHAPLEPGDASGMNLMDLAARDWWRPALEATAPDLAPRLPPIVAPWSLVGTLAPYWQARYGFAAAPVVVWTGDNPSSLVGVGIVEEERLAVSLGTSDTVFAAMSEPSVDDSGTGHVFGAPTGNYMGLTCFQNGSLARERVRDTHGLDWPGFSRALASTPPGNAGRIMLPWFAAEITPPVGTAGVRRYGPNGDAAANVRAVVEGQQLAMALHTRWMRRRVDAIHATGGAAVNAEILKVMANVFGVPVFRLPVGNSAALGAALRAAHADMLEHDPSTGWSAVVRGLAEPLADSRVDPDPHSHAVYRDMLPMYAACEAHALGRGPEPPESWFDRVASQRAGH
jgi:xylulokinase